MAFLKRSSAWPAQPARPIKQTSNATEGPFIVLPFGPVSPHRISAAKSQNKVNEARGHAQISIDRQRRPVGGWFGAVISGREVGAPKRWLAASALAKRGSRTTGITFNGPTSNLVMTALEPLSPDRVRGLDGQPQLRALVRLGERVAAGAAGEAALRANGEPLGGDIFRRFIDAPLQAIERFEHRHFAADQPEHDALSLRDEAQRCKVAGSRRVIFEQEMVCVRAREK